MAPNPEVMMPPPIEARTHAHPRRTPAARSVSLRHAQPIRTDDESGSSIEGGQHRHLLATNSPSSLEALGGRNSSGESSNAENWFEKSNNEVRDNSASFADNDPPFFMRNSSSSETPPDVHPHIKQFTGPNDLANSLPLRAGLLHLATDGSSTEEFRSVIDDLTIENKKLKRRLKNYEKMHDSHLKDEKLFEVRIHSLPPEKKRELEETLRKFASSLNPGAAGAFPPNGYASLLPMLKASKASSSQTSLRHADSAYASMSGQGSSSDPRHKMTPANYLENRRQNIHSYLHDIPEGLLPQHNPATMTEKAKRKLVVRRMEELFAGKGAAAMGNQQSIQQQEVSQSAAMADRHARESEGQRSKQEGSREAPIMDRETEDPMDMRQGDEKLSPTEPSDRLAGPEASVAQKDFASSPTHPNVEQRPTRPLDLDPHQAQVPSDNFRYMQHLGFSPPGVESSNHPVNGHGWIYLNFLINMAQLHTINVTTDFVSKALSDHSEKFQVSSDGRKVRWRGGSSITRTSSSGETSSHERGSADTSDGQSPRKRPKLFHGLSSNGSSARQGGASSRSRLQSETSRNVYTPMFAHKDSADDSSDSSSQEEDDNMSSAYQAPMMGDSSAMTSSGNRTSSCLPTHGTKRKQKRDDGPIIFYNNARFCTDLSGDRKPSGNCNAPFYTTASAVPIGKSHTVSDAVIEKRGPLANASLLPEPMSISDNPVPDKMEIFFPAQSPLSSGSNKPQELEDLEVTGIGGVWPADNFAISVQSRHVRIDEQRTTAENTSLPPKAVPRRFAEILHGSQARPSPIPVVSKELVAAKVHDLPPSDLPEALGFMPSEDDSLTDDESDVDEETSEAPELPGDFPPSAAPQPVDIPYASSEDESEEDDDEDDDDDEESDGEVDFLAAARQLDPEAIRQKEREYDANMAERLAEEIPAGSSAATAGGGSGFASPASGVDRREYRRAMERARASARPTGVRRAHTSDSRQVAGMQDCSSSESSDDDDDDETSDIGS